MTSGKRFWTCDCGSMGRLSDKRCEICGSPRPVSAEGGWRTPAAHADDRDGTCEFKSAGRCLLRAVSYRGVGTRASGYCVWHSTVLDSPQSNTLEEFERFCADLRRVLYCSSLTHHPALSLWKRMSGVNEPLPVPAPCNLGACPHAAPTASDEDVRRFRALVQSHNWDGALEVMCRERMAAANATDLARHKGRQREALDDFRQHGHGR